MGQFSVHYCLYMRLVPSFSNTLFHIIPMLTTHIYIYVPANDHSLVNELIQGSTDIKQWMAENFYSSMTAIFLVGPKALTHQIHPLSIHLPVKPSEHVNNLGVIPDRDLSFHKHISNMSKSAFYHLRTISKVRPFMSQLDSEKLVHAFISNRLDYCNALFAGLSKQVLNKLQLI